jgi:drug/metabolite transporter (DMT)-like permease
VLAVVCALGSAVLYALASVLQHRGAMAQPDDQSLKVGLLVRLARQPAWLTGLACDVGGYVLQFVALGHGPIIVVQTLLVCGLLFALPIGAAWSGRRLDRKDWIGAFLVCAGLACFLGVADPAAGRDDASTGSWVVLLVTVAVLALALTAASLGPDARRRAVLLAGATGVVYGAAAALTKTSAHLLGHGLVPLVTNWQPYALVVFGAAGMLLSQSAFQAGVLDFSLPTMTVADPIASIAIGAVVLREAISSSPAAITIEVVSLLAMSGGVWLLARFEAELARPVAKPV